MLRRWEYKFGIYNSKNENVKLGEVSITGSALKLSI